MPSWLWKYNVGISYLLDGCYSAKRRQPASHWRAKIATWEPFTLVTVWLFDFPKGHFWFHRALGTKLGQKKKKISDWNAFAVRYSSVASCDGHWARKCSFPSRQWSNWNASTVQHSRVEWARQASTIKRTNCPSCICLEKWWKENMIGNSPPMAMRSLILAMIVCHWFVACGVKVKETPVFTQKNGNGASKRPRGGGKFAKVTPGLHGTQTERYLHIHNGQRWHRHQTGKIAVRNRSQSDEKWKMSDFHANRPVGSSAGGDKCLWWPLTHDNVPLQQLARLPFSCSVMIHFRIPCLYRLLQIKVIKTSWGSSYGKKQ